MHIVPFRCLMHACMFLGLDGGSCMCLVTLFHDLKPLTLTIVAGISFDSGPGTFENKSKIPRP